MKKKLNIIDFIVILCVACALIFTVIKLKGGGDSAANIFTGSQKVIIECEAREVLPFLADKLTVGDVLVSQKKYQDGKIIEIAAEDDFTIGAIDGKIVKIPRPEYKFIRLKIEANVNRYGSYMEQGGQPIQVGNKYYVKTENAMFLSIISRVTMVEDK